MHNSTFSQAANGVFGSTTVQNATGQKKQSKASSKNQQRRKISATNQSTQFVATSQIAQTTINYPQTIKKKNSKANMLIDPQGQPSGQVSAFSQSGHHNSVSLSRTQTHKLQSNLNAGQLGGSMKQAPAEHMMADAMNGEPQPHPSFFQE